VSVLSFGLSFFGGGCVVVVSVVSVVDVVAVSVGGAVSLLVVVVVVFVGGGRRLVVRGGGWVVVDGAGYHCACGAGAGVVVAGRGGAGMPLAIAPGCCGGITPPAGPPGIFGTGVVVGSVPKLPVVSVFVAVATGGCTSPGALIVDVALLVCPSWITSYCC